MPYIVFRRSNIDEEDSEIVEEIDSHTLHKPVRRQFLTVRVVQHSVDHQQQTDLVDLINVKKYNQAYRYLLATINIQCKYACAIPLKTKREEEIVKTFQTIFASRKVKLHLSDA